MRRPLLALALLLALAGTAPARAQEPLTFEGRVTELEGIDVVGAIENRVRIVVAPDQDTLRLEITLRVEDRTPGQEFCQRVDVATDPLTAREDRPGEGILDLVADARVNVVQVFSASTCDRNDLPGATTQGSAIQLRLRVLPTDERTGEGSIFVGDDPLSTLTFRVGAGSGEPEEPTSTIPGDLLGLDAILNGSSVLDASTVALLRRLGECPDSARCQAAGQQAREFRQILAEALPGQIDRQLLGDAAAIFFVSHLRDAAGDLIAPGLSAIEPVLARLLAHAGVDGDDSFRRAANRLAGFVLTNDIDARFGN